MLNILHIHADAILQCLIFFALLGVLMKNNPAWDGYKRLWRMRFWKVVDWRNKLGNY